MCIRDRESNSSLDPNSRITPILFFQPHFYNISYDISVDTKSNKTVLHSEQYDRIRSSAVFQNFKYIKTFTPIPVSYTHLFATLSGALVLTVERKWDRRLWKSLLVYWLFLLSWLPITIGSFFKQTTVWEEIRHTRNVLPEPVLARKW